MYQGSYFITSLSGISRLTSEQLSKEENHWRNSIEYKQYLRAIEVDPALRLCSDTAFEFSTVERLVEQGFLIASEAFRAEIARLRGGAGRRYWISVTDSSVEVRQRPERPHSSSRSICRLPSFQHPNPPHSSFWAAG